MNSCEKVMFPRITRVRYVRDYLLEVEFADGLTATLDFRSRVVGRGGVFTLLEDVEFFRQVTVDRDAGTLLWPNDLDLDPDVLYSRASGKPLPVVQPAVDSR